MAKNATPFTDAELTTLGDLMDPLRDLDAVKTTEKPLFSTRDDDRTYEERAVHWRTDGHMTTETRTETVEEPRQVERPTADGAGVMMERTMVETERTRTHEVRVVTDSYIEVTLTEPNAIDQICDIVAAHGFDPGEAITCVDADAAVREATYEIRPVTADE